MPAAETKTCELDLPIWGFVGYAETQVNLTYAEALRRARMNDALTGHKHCVLTNRAAGHGQWPCSGCEIILTKVGQLCAACQGESKSNGQVDK
jgi:hypothetical protein